MDGFQVGTRSVLGCMPNVSYNQSLCRIKKSSFYKIKDME